MFAINLVMQLQVKNFIWLIGKKKLIGRDEEKGKHGKEAPETEMQNEMYPGAGSYG